jgi:hypothetical protein
MKTSLYLIGLLVTNACKGEAKQQQAPADPDSELRRRVSEGPFVDVEIRDIAMAYTDNAVAAEDRFKGKVIRTSGNIVEIASDAAITVLDRDSGATVRCEWGGTRESAAALKREFRYVRGIGGDFSGRTFTMRLCDVGEIPDRGNANPERDRLRRQRDDLSRRLDEISGDLARATTQADRDVAKAKLDALKKEYDEMKVRIDSPGQK